MANFNIIDEYKEVTIEEIMKLTNLPNPYTDQTKYSLARQKELLLKDAKRKNILHLVEKSNPRQNLVPKLIEDKDLSIRYLTNKGEVNLPTRKINLELVKHKSFDQETFTIIEIKKSDLGPHIVRSTKPGAAYTLVKDSKVIKLYFDKTLYSKDKIIGTSFKSNSFFNIKLHLIF